MSKKLNLANLAKTVEKSSTKSMMKTHGGMKDPFPEEGIDECLHNCSWFIIIGAWNMMQII